MSSTTTLSPAQQRWKTIMHDSSLKELPYKVETNPYGQIVLSPTSYDHGRMQVKVNRLLEDIAREAGLDGEASIEVSVEIRPGQVKVPGVAWISAERLAQRSEGYALTVMPEVVVEIVCPDNIDFHCRVARKHRIFYLWRPQLNDPNDEMVLELAVRANADAIITFNERDFRGVEAFGIETLTPGAFLRRIGVHPEDHP